MLLDRRRSGVLLHPTSLPGSYGIGDLGPAAYEFLDFLARAKQSVWQVLPLGPTGFGDSPYASPSAFAGNPLLIAPELLVQQGLLEQPELSRLQALEQHNIDFAQLKPLKDELLNAAAQRHTRQQQAAGDSGLQVRIDAFRHAQGAWLEDFALFAALTEAHGAWTGWPEPLRAREPHALDEARNEHRDRVDFHVFCQYLFFDQWSALRARANAVGISIMGDIPIFVAHDSADVWANPHLFKLDATGHPTVVAGVPPDYFSATGQLWGNPLYDWQAMAAHDYAWWVARFRHLLELVDLVRVDHFRGFEAAWEVPASATTAIEGAWIPGPGRDVFEAVNRALGEQVPIIAEDLGLITDAVRDLLASTGFPGMKVLQFAFGGGTDNFYLPHNYRDPNCIVYTGTHDNDTTRGWFSAAPAHDREFVLRYLGASASDDVTYGLIRLALGSIANTALVPLQDVLDLGSDARMNTPGATGSSWAWRVRAEQLDVACADRLAELTTLYGRT